MEEGGLSLLGRNRNIIHVSLAPTQNARKARVRVQT